MFLIHPLSLGIGPETVPATIRQMDTIRDPVPVQHDVASVAHGYLGLSSFLICSRTQAKTPSYRCPGVEL